MGCIIGLHQILFDAVVEEHDFVSGILTWETSHFLTHFLSHQYFVDLRVLSAKVWLFRGLIEGPHVLPDSGNRDLGNCLGLLGSISWCL